MIIRSSGFEIDGFYIPPFELNKGELLNLIIFSGGHFFDLERKLRVIFSGKQKQEQILIDQPLQFVENFYDFNYRRFLIPITVQKFLNKSANIEQIDKIDIWKDFNYSKTTKLITIPNYDRRLLALISALSNSKNLMFDLTGIDPKNAISFLKKIKKITNDGGSAIFINNFDDETENGFCDKRVVIQQIKN